MTKAGKSFDCEVAIRCVVPTQGRFPLFTVVIRDITERRRAEDQMKRFNKELECRVAERTRELDSSSALLAAVLNSVGDAILTVDERGVIRSANRAASELFGYRESELPGMDVNRLLHESVSLSFEGAAPRLGSAKEER